VRVIPFAIFLLAFIIQSTSATPLRLGEIGEQLSSDDIAAIERISQKIGGKPWLLIGQREQVGQSWNVRVYLPPEKSNNLLRRGPMCTVWTGPADLLPAKRTWAFRYKDDASEYAQVAIDGRRFDEIRNYQDTNVPFAVTGEISDDELVRLVKFIRSGAPKPVQSQLPILSISRYPDRSLVIYLFEDHWHGQVLTLAPKDGGWVVTHIQSWVV
jgi:hypothetical protein